MMQSLFVHPVADQNLSSDSVQNSFIHMSIYPPVMGFSAASKKVGDG